MKIGDRVVTLDEGEDWSEGHEGVIVAPTEEDAHMLLEGGEEGQVIGSFGASGPHWLVLLDGYGDPSQIPEDALETA